MNETLSREETGRVQVAYFSMEVGLQADLPTYSGGLGVLAGDTLKASADQGLPVVGVTLVHRRGYFRQHLDPSGHQTESDEAWSPEERLEEMEPRVLVRIEGHDVWVRAWRLVASGSNGNAVPVYFLDTQLPENQPEHRALTDHLYGGDLRYRLGQEIVLGVGGVRMLRALGYEGLRVFHMNEGHSALLTTALLEEEVATRGAEGVTPEIAEAVRQRCVFTTHTPVPAGHDQFDHELVEQLLDGRAVQLMEQAHGFTEGTLNMTHLALRLSRYANAVALRHGQVSREMFPGYRIAEITNGVHAETWVADPMKELFDRRIAGWRANPVAFRHAIGIPSTELQRAHAAAKRGALDAIRERTGVALDPGVLTIGFARRAARYKRAELIFRDLERLREIARTAGPIQLVISGKAHPADEAAKATIRQVHEAAEALRGEVPVVYVEDYNMSAARDLVAGVDLWLNNPQRPLEASGTSGMKAAMNGVPSLSTLDGWWIEGHIEGVTGWSIGNSWEPAPDAKDAEQLYSKLELVVAPLYYRQPERWTEVMRQSIALNGSFFNAHRMVMQYAQEAYQL